MITQHEAENAVLLVTSLVSRMLNTNQNPSVQEAQILVVLDELKRIEDYITCAVPGDNQPGTRNVIIPTDDLVKGDSHKQQDLFKGISDYSNP